MPVTAIVGAQWGDEGKGRIVDYLAQRADMVIRFQGGDNAGHTVVNEAGAFRLHLVPSGIFNPATQCIVGTGMVVNPQALLDEMAGLAAAGISVDNLWLSERARTSCCPITACWTGWRNPRAAAIRSGPPSAGIGPAYADKAGRTGIRLGDLTRPYLLQPRLAHALDAKNRELARLGGEALNLGSLLEQATAWGRALAPRIVDTLPRIHDAVKGGKRILLEGQLGVMRDLDWGTYPYVTSSNPLSGGATVGAGLPPAAITEVIGVVKAYCTAVGAGPFPTELHDDTGAQLRAVGQEYGATTGRPRRCGWLDGVALPYATWLNGFTGLAITKLDVLDNLAEIKVCTGYRLEGQVIARVPYPADMDRVEPVYETWPGWQAPTKEARTWRDLPWQAQAYLRRIEALAGAPVRYVSVGPERGQLIAV